MTESEVLSQRTVEEVGEVEYCYLVVRPGRRFALSAVELRTLPLSNAEEIELLTRSRSHKSCCPHRVRM